MPLTISRILHAGYVFECDGTAIAFDPVFENPFSRNCHAFPDARFDLGTIRQLRFAAVFISHFHDDHCSLESLDLIDRSTPIYLYCRFPELFEMVRALGFVQVHALAVDTPVRAGPIEVIAREALDADVDCMFHVRAAGLNVLNVVDSWMDPDTLTQLAAFAPWDMVLWPYQTMREIDVLSPSRASAAPAELPADWFEHLAALKPRFVVPSACQFEQEPWSWYNRAFFPVTYRQFQRETEAALPGTRVVRFNPSVSMLLDSAGLHPAPPLDWVIPVGEQDVDYRYDPHIVAPPTSGIARHFPALTAPQTERVLRYCAEGLLEKYRDMELEPGGYFDRVRVWRLSLFDHEGMRTDFLYRTEGDRIERLEHEAPVSWCTEVPIAKLYVALALGESLTSMYMRINDMRFAPEVEQQLEQADITDDPLIRCLFNDVFGAYQAAQLRRLLRT